MGRLGGKRIEVVVLVRDEVHRTAERVEQPRIPLFGLGDDLVADEGPKTVGMGIGRIFSPAAPLPIRHRFFIGQGKNEISQILTRHVKAGPHDRSVAIEHRAEPAGARPRYRAHEEVLNAIVLCMGETGMAS